MNDTRRWTLRACALWIFVAPLIALEARAQETIRWETLYTTAGITVSAGHRASAELPMLKGTGVLDVNLYHLLAIVEDVQRHTEWVYRVAQSEIVTRPTPLRLRAYLRFDFPWPASDRDGIVNVNVKRSWSPHHEIRISFARTVDRRKPPLDGVVRVPRSRGHTVLRWISPTRTHVEYMIDTDPGGNLPKWLVRFISRDLPLRILKGLQGQVSRTGQDYDAFYEIWDPRRTWQADSPKTFKLSGVSPQTLARPPLPAPSEASPIQK